MPLADLTVTGEAKVIPGETITPQAHRMVPASLDLRGARVEEALEMLDTYLDQAAVAERASA